MHCDDEDQGSTAELMEGWLRARSLSRGLPQPVSDRGGLRLDTGLPHERRRYLFSRPSPGLRELAQEIIEPLVFLKLWGGAEELAPLLPQRWAVQTSRWAMTCDGPMPGEEASAPDPYRLELSSDGPVTLAHIFAPDGTLAASGRAAEAFGVFIYDQISTVPAHRRRGIGRALMQSLASRRRSQGARQVLVATEEGRALYETLGWRVCSPYTTAVIPQDGAARET